MAKILKNNTGSAINLTDIGVTVAASPGQYTVPAQDYPLLAASTVTAAKVLAGDIIVNDGTNDLSATVGGALLASQGDITGPGASVTDNTLAVFSGTTGKLIKSSTLANAGVAPNDAQYVTLATNSVLTNERVLTGTSNQITITDNGAGSSVVLSLPQNINITATPQFSSVKLTDIDQGAIPFANSSNVLVDAPTKLFWDNSVDALCVGNAQSTQSIDGVTESSRVILETSGSSNEMDLFVHRHAATAAPKASLGLARSRGSAASPSAIQIGDSTGSINFFGHDGSTWRYAAQIISQIDSGTVSSSSMPGVLRFLVTPNASTTLAEAMKITNDKAITMAAYGTGIAHFSSAGLISSSLIVNADVSGSAAIDYSKLNLSNSIVNADVNSSAAIARSKLAVGTANHVVINDSGGAFSSEANLAVSRGGTGTGSLTANNVILGNGTSAVTFVAPGTSGNVLTSNGTTWVSQAGGAGTGDVVGPGSATDNAVARFDGATGKLIQNSVVIVSDTGAITGVTDLAISGSTASNFINASGTLNNATGDEIAYVLDFTVNKAISGTTTGLKINMTDTSSPGTAYLMDLQKGAAFKFRVDENGNTEVGNITGTAGSGIRIDGGSASGADLKLRSTSHATPGNVQIEDNILFDGTLFKTTASSFTIRDVINRDILVVNATDMFINDVPVTIENDITTTGSIFITPTAGGGAQDPSMTLTAPAHTSLTAGAEYHDLLIDLNRTITWAAGDVATQRFLYIDSPVMTMGSVNTFTEAVTVAIAGPPTILGGSAMQITTAIGFKMEQVAIPAGVSTGIGFVIYAPTTGGASTVSVGSFMDGNLGVNTLTPGTYLDVKVPSLSSGGNDISCIDGTTRYAGMYVGGTSITVAPGSGTSGFLLDFGWAPGSNSAFGVAANQTFFRAEGSVNMSGAVSCGVFTFSEAGTGGTATNSRAIVAQYNTASGSTRAVTTGRSQLIASNIQGTNTITTLPLLDFTQTFAAVAGTTTTGHYIRMNAPSVGAGYTLSNFDAILIEDFSGTVGSRKTALRVLGTNYHSRHVANLMIGADSTPGHKLEVKDGNIAITNTTNAGELRFYEPSAGANYTAFKAQAQTNDITYTLPAADGTSGQVLQTNGSGTLSWVTGGGGSTHNLLSATHTDTVTNTVTRGSLIYGNSTPAWDELTIGASGTVLKSDGTDASWGTIAVPVTYMKTTGTTKDNNTMTDDSVMSGMTLATGKYTFIGFFWVSAASTTPDFKFQLTVNTSTVNDIKYFWHATIASGAVQEGFVTASATSSGIINVAASGQTYIRVTGSMDVTNAGSLDVEWAQNTTDAVNLVTMNRGSWFQLTAV